MVSYTEQFIQEFTKPKNYSKILQISKNFSYYAWRFGNIDLIFHLNPTQTFSSFFHRRNLFDKNKQKHRRSPNKIQLKEHQN